MYRLTAMHSVTDGRADRQADNITMQIADHTAWKYNRLKTKQETEDRRHQVNL